MPTRYSKACLIALLAANGSYAQTTSVDLSSQTREADFRSFSFTRPIKTGTSLPSTCTVGDVYLLSSAATGRSLHVCQATNVWSLQGGELASTEDAQYGMNDDRTMTPLKTAQAIAAQCSLPSPMGMAGGLLTTDGSTSSWTRRLVMSPLNENVTSAAHTISANRFFVQLNPTASHTLSSTPTIAPGLDGQFLVLTNINATASLILQDQAALAGSKLRLGGANVTLAPFQSVQLVFSVLADAWLRADQMPAAGGGGGGGGAVASVFGRAGTVTAQNGDYNASQVTNAVSTTGSYANPAWLTSLAYSKLTGTPSLQYQTVRINGGADLPQRARLNISAGANVTVTTTDDAGGNTTNVVVAAAGGGGGGGTGATTKTFLAAKCQNTVAGAGFSVGTSNAPTALCDSGADSLFGVLRFTADGQRVFDSFPLPPTFSSITAVFSARTTSTSGNSVFAIATACVGDNEDLGSGGVGGPVWGTPQLVSIGAKPTANRNAFSSESSISTTGCSANELFLFRISRDSSTSTVNPELISVSFKVQ